MTWRRWAYSALWLICAAAPAYAVGEAGVITEYDVRYGPLTILSIRAQTDLGDRRYRTTTEMRTVGLAGLLFPWHSSATTEGLQDTAGLRPLEHRSAGEYRGQQRTVLIDYAAGGAVSAAIQPPPDADYREAVPVALQQRTVDPLTATLSALTLHCRGTVPVFDGRRRYDIRLTDLGDTDVPPSGSPVYSGRARRCRSEIIPLAGFWRVEPNQDERPTRLDYWIAAPKAGLPPVPVYLELSAPRGTLSIHLTALAAATQGDAAP